ncbi:MAG: hypothetical protein ACHQUC_07100 [Chlamydiales bacterium]
MANHYGAAKALTAAMDLYRKQNSNRSPRAREVRMLGSSRCRVIRSELKSQI